MATRFKGPFVYEPEISVATTPSAAIADAISQIGRYWFIANGHQCSKGKARFCYYNNDIFYSISATQPVTYVRCNAQDVNATTMQFPRLDQGNGNYPLVDYNSTAIGSQPWSDLSTGNGSNPSSSWFELPEAHFGRSSIGAVVALARADLIDKPGQVLACTIDARWSSANATVSFSNGPMMVSGLPNRWFLGGQHELGANGLPLWPQIKISPEWAKSINPIIAAESSTSVFTMLCNSVGPSEQYITGTICPSTPSNPSSPSC